MNDIKKFLNIVEGVPTTFKATHFHKSNLFGAKNDLMFNPEDGKFYWKDQGEIAPWNGNVNNRAGYNPASVDGEIVDGKYVDYPEGVTFADKQKEKAAGGTEKPAQPAAQKPAASGPGVSGGKLTLSDGSAFSKEPNSQQLLNKKAATLVDRMVALLKKMNESIPVSLRGYLTESDKLALLLEALSPAEVEELKKIYADLRAIEQSGFLAIPRNQQNLKKYLDQQGPKIDSLSNTNNTSSAKTFPVPDSPKIVGEPTSTSKPAADKPAADKPADAKPADAPATTKFSKDEVTGPEGGQYTIKPGDNLTKIAKAYGTTVDELMKLNPQIKDANKIAAGAKLNVPGKTEPKAAEPAKPETKPEEKPKADVPTPGVAEPRSAAGVAADPENTGNAEDPEAQVFMQDTPTAAKQLSRAILGPGTDEEAIFKVISQVKSKADWDKLQKEYKTVTGNDLVTDLKGDLDDTDMARYVWDPLRKAGVDKNAPAASPTTTPASTSSSEPAKSAPAPAGKMTMAELQKIKDDTEFLKALVANPDLAKQLNMNIDDIKKALGQ